MNVVADELEQYMHADSTQEQICEASASFDLSSVDLATAIEETTQLGVRLTEMVSAETDIGDTGDGATSMCKLLQFSFFFFFFPSSLWWLIFMHIYTFV